MDNTITYTYTVEGNPSSAEEIHQSIKDAIDVGSISDETVNEYSNQLVVRILRAQKKTDNLDVRYDEQTAIEYEIAETSDGYQLTYIIETERGAPQNTLNKEQFEWKLKKSDYTFVEK